MNRKNSLLAALIIGSTWSLSAQEQGGIVENTSPSFHRSFENYKRSNADKELHGFRVQVYNGNRNEASDYRRRFVRAFPQMTSMVIFESPDYKLQVGNYRDAFEAERALEQIRTEFPGAFVVETAIDAPSASPTVEDIPANQAPDQRRQEAEPQQNEKPRL